MLCILDKSTSYLWILKGGKNMIKKIKIGAIIKDAMAYVVRVWVCAIFFCCAFENGWLPCFLQKAFGKSRDIPYEEFLGVYFFFITMTIIIMFFNGMTGKYKKLENIDF